MQTTIIVSYDAGWGNHLAIRGGPPLSWDSGTVMESVDSNTWRLELDLTEPLEFKPKLNDEIWAFGLKDYRLEPGEQARIFPHFLQTPGWADAIGYIPYKGRDVTVRLYTPPGYKENAQRRYPVLYCLDGHALFENGVSSWHLDEYLNALIESRAVEPLLVVGVDCWDAGQSDSPLSEARATEFAPFVLKLKETIDRNYPTLPEREHTGLLGATAGGLLALWLGRHHAERFSRVAAMSPTFWWPVESLTQNSRSDGHAGQKIYLCANEEGGSLLSLTQALKTDGWVEGEDLMCQRLEQAERETGWASRVGSPLRFLFPWSGR